MQVHDLQTITKSRTTQISCRLVSLFQIGKLCGRKTMTNRHHPRLAPRFIQVWTSIVVAVASLATSSSLSGCAGGDKPAPSPSNEAAELFQGPAAAKARGEQAEGVWTIAIAGVREDQELARAALERVQTVGGLREAYLDVRDKTIVVAYGRYGSAGDPKAQADLKRIREFQHHGERPFSAAVLTPPPNLTVLGSIPELDLNTVRADSLRRAKYTLQVGVYGRLDNKPPTASDLAEFRRLAEQAAAKLRREGDEAYYYHGRSKSMVLIGAYDESEYDEKNPGLADGTRLRAAREKFPYNLVNGAGYQQRKVGAEKGSLQRSQIVRIPE